MILVKVDLKERLARLKQGLQMIFFSIVKVLSNMIFPYFECMHLGLVSFAFFSLRLVGYAKLFSL